jgi:hypothetical protein
MNPFLSLSLSLSRPFFLFPAVVVAAVRNCINKTPTSSSVQLQQAATSARRWETENSAQTTREPLRGRKGGRVDIEAGLIFLSLDWSPNFSKKLLRHVSLARLSYRVAHPYSDRPPTVVLDFVIIILSFLINSSLVPTAVSYCYHLITVYTSYNSHFEIFVYILWIYPESMVSSGSLFKSFKLLLFLYLSKK